MYKQSGFTMLEVVISLGIFSIIIVVISLLITTIFTQNSLSESRSSIDTQSLVMLRNFAAELRAAQTAHDGSYPIARADDDEVMVFTDLRGDNTVERVRYFIENTTLKRGELAPSGQPLGYDPGNEVVHTLVENIVPAPPYFIYYGGSFDGVSSTDPLIQPITPTDVTVVEIDVRVDPKVLQQDPRVLNTRVMIRSLKND